jgi:hypothetical protein
VSSNLSAEPKASKPSIDISLEATELEIEHEEPKVIQRQLHETQLEVFENSDRFNVVVCGRRWGKTFLGEEIAINAILEHKLVGWFAPNYKFLNESYKGIRNRLSNIVTSSNASDNRIELIKGGVIEFWTLENPDAGRSRKYDVVVIDEAGLVLELGDRWREAIRATLIDRKGTAWFFGTPKPPKTIQLKDYAFYQFYLRGFEAEGGWKSFHQPTRTNPFISKSELNSMRHEPGMTYRVARQEIDAEFLKDSADALWKMDIIAPHRRPCPPNVKKIKTIIFLDPGNFSTSENADPSGLVVASKGSDGHYYVLADLSGAMTPLQCAQRVANASQLYQAPVFFESNQGGEYVKHAIQSVSQISITGIASTQAKEQRATTPVSFYELGQVHHDHEFVEMESEMVNWNPYDSKIPSPNRMDALVGALNQLMKPGTGVTRITNRINHE